MKYLLYYKEGFLKKFLLDKPEFIIGRGSENDLIIDEDLISRKHLNVKVEKNHILIRDLNSRNGTFVDGRKIIEAKISIGESFILKDIEFILKKGSMDEFKLSEDLVPIFNDIRDEKVNTIETFTTKYSKDIFSELLKYIIQEGLKKNNFNELVLDISRYISSFNQIDNMFLIIKNNEDINIVFSIKRDKGVQNLFKKIIKKKNIFNSENIWQSVPGKKDSFFFSFPLMIKKDNAVLIYIPGNNLKKYDNKYEKFLSLLAKELSFLSQLLIDKKIGTLKNNYGALEDINIIGSNKQMINLINQAKKIAKSNIFILIQGETGTGKELFAKLIHNNSKNRKGKYVAFNCAAIPENLLESELFGYEKGAFTGADAQRKGKLELASGGTLVLDEIGEMPVLLQVKLLRVLQEQEFYRLGGTVSIKVDLRIITMTNANLMKNIDEGKFREDLYFRLAHHLITIPPLRERKEDISELINFFTNKYCKINNKNIKGYSVKAFEILQNYYWRGNVRQLENEINRLVNLVENDETIDHEILSDSIKNADYTMQEEKNNPAYFFDKKYEKKIIYDLLKKNNWNKSKTAKNMNMTYRGLHEKMKRMDIKREKI